MAEHDLVLNAGRLNVTSKDIEIVVRSRKSRLGTLKISKGSLDWRDKYDQYSRVLSWEKFAEIAKRYGYKRKRR